MNKCVKRVVVGILICIMLMAETLSVAAVEESTIFQDEETTAEKEEDTFEMESEGESTSEIIDSQDSEEIAEESTKEMEVVESSNSTEETIESEQNLEDNIKNLSEEKASIRYLAHVQDYGWRQWVADGAEAGSTNENRRLEAIMINVDAPEIEGSIQYQTHVQDYGWRQWKNAGEVSGSINEGRRIEAIKIRLTGELANKYDVYYRVHVQNIGWLGWAKNGEMAGTEEMKLRVESIQIQLVEQNGTAPGNTNRPFIIRPEVTYSSHVQDYGWRDKVGMGETSGSIGESRRMEAIKIDMSDNALSGTIQYRTHVQNRGWLNWSTAGSENGTTNQKLRIEAIQICLTGEMSNFFDVYYRSHVQNYGWLDWAKDGATSGTTGMNLRVEAFQIKVVPKGQTPGSTARPSICLPTLVYNSHVQDYGWRDWVAAGNTSGSVNENRRMEAIQIKFTDADLSGNIQYRTHVQYQGWQNWSNNGQANGSTGHGWRVEAIEIKLTGELEKAFDVYYRTYVENYGWLGWAKNGETAGTSGLALRMEAYEVVLVPKGNPAPGGGVAHKEYTKPGIYVIGDKYYYYVSNGVKKTGTGWIRENGSRYYLLNDACVTGWNYIGGYKYYFYSDGRLCQDVDSIIGAQSNYVIKVNKQMNCITIYASDGANGYIIPVKAMLCSTGDDTPLGTFYTPMKYRWQGMFNGTYAQYATRLTAGQGFLFHSITYESKNNRTLLTEGYNGLGVTRSAGCIRLVCGNAYWIYTRCALGTKVIVYNDPNPGPFDRPVLVPIPSTQRWDPTDPNI